MTDTRDRSDYMKNYYKANREKLLEKRAKVRVARRTREYTPTDIVAPDRATYMKLYRAKNQDASTERNRRYWKENKEAISLARNMDITVPAARNLIRIMDEKRAR